MGRTNGYRAGTRDMFSRDFKKRGPEHLTTYLKIYKVGDIVDIKANSSIHKGMPHKYYHGKTGIVYNVTRRAVGVIVNKRVGGRIMHKHVNLRIEHIKHSTCRQDFLDRREKNERAKAAARETGERLNMKRQAKQPIAGHYVTTEDNAPQRIYALAYAGLE
eukprot:Pgem_evm1s1929